MDLLLRHIRARLVCHIRQSYTNAYKQHISTKLKAKLANHNGYASGTVILQRIGSEPDSYPSLVLQTPNQSYLFNCSEGVGRTLVSHDIQIDTVTEIFLTQNNWSTMGGIMTMLLPAMFSTEAPPNFHGPDNLFEAIRRISLLSSLGKTFIATIGPHIVTAFYEDEDVRIDKIPIASRKKAEGNIHSYLCKLKALRGDKSVKNPEDSCYMHRQQQTMTDVHYSDREEANFLSKCNST